MAWTKQNKDKDRDKVAEPSVSSERSASAPTRSAEHEALREKGNGARPLHLGRVVLIDGDVTATADVNVEGTVNGKVVAKDHVVTVAKHGRITDDVLARTVIVAGEVTGNVEAKDRVEIIAQGSVQGDIRASRVLLSEGAQFSGKINMGLASAEEEKNPETASVAAG